MNQPRRITRILALAVVTLVGAGACTFDPQERAGADRPASANKAERGSGASDTAGPDQKSTKRNPKPTKTTPAPTKTVKKPDPTKTTSSDRGSCPQGEKQREVETYLAKLGGFGRIKVDGKQSIEDCSAIKKFQKRYDIRPAEGRAGPLTLDVARRLASTNTAKCKTGTGTTFCIDLTLQTVWAMQGSKVIMKPTVTRTGMKDFATPPGTYKINFRNIKEWSDPYEVWMPYWQHFTQGMGFHEATTYLHNPVGSHGCINMLPADAKTLWSLGKVGTRVHAFGHRAGT
ncbi:L,D-transpeptidase family protein [Micromonospora sp. NPDC003197]